MVVDNSFESYACHDEVSSSDYHAQLQSAGLLEMVDLNLQDYRHHAHEAITFQDEQTPHDVQECLNARLHNHRNRINRVNVVNLASLIINMSLALISFYLSLDSDNVCIIAFSVDCILDSLSSAIVIWRYNGYDPISPFVYAREQMACVYLGALFVVSAIAITLESLSSLSIYGASEVAHFNSQSAELLYLAAVASVACFVITLLKFYLFKLLHDKSLLVDVINSVISTIFAMSIVLSQLLMRIDYKFSYLDPTLSLFLAFFMAQYGLRIIYENMKVIKEAHVNPPNLLSKNGNAYSQSYKSID